jgi:hypothetical protein
VTLSGDFGGEFTSEQQTTCRQEYANAVEVDLASVVIVEFRFEGRRLNAGDLSVQLSATTPSEQVQSVLELDADSLSTALANAGVPVTGVSQSVQTVAPKSRLTSTGDIEAILMDAETFNADLLSALGEQGVVVDEIDRSYEIVETPSSNDGSDGTALLVGVIVGAVVGTALLAGGVGLLVKSRRTQQMGSTKSFEMRPPSQRMSQENPVHEKKEPVDMM